MDLNERRRPRWGYPFFGLVDSYKVQIHELIFDLCHYGKLGYDAVYSMPVQYRMFYMNKLINIKEREKREYESAGNTGPTSQKVVKGPGINR